jgi:hypothetical protein
MSREGGPRGRPAGPRHSGYAEGKGRKNGEVEGWAGWGIWPKRVLENSKDFSIFYF